VPGWLPVVPAAWSVIVGSASVLPTVPQDWMLLLGGLGATAGLVFWQRRQLLEQRTA
jgi:hypothetical protein